MHNLFTFTKGEYVASSFILLMIMAGFAFSIFYNNSSMSKYDYSKFKSEIDKFEKEQLKISDSLTKCRYGNYDNRDTSKKKRPLMYDIVKIDLNRCDTSDIVRVPQFGSKRAAAIVAYRDRLGGFSSLSQLQEIFILQDISLDYVALYFSVDKSAIKKIDINQADYKQLVSHPYFDAYLTKTILQFRSKNGIIHDETELQKVTHAYPALMEKLKPYIVY